MKRSFHPINGNVELEWKVIVEFCDSIHLLKVKKALETEVKFAKYLNNKHILVCAVSREQQIELTKVSTIDGKK